MTDNLLLSNLYICPSLTILISAIIQSCQLSCPSGTGPAQALKVRPLYSHVLQHIILSLVTLDISYFKKA